MVKQINFNELILKIAEAEDKLFFFGNFIVIETALKTFSKKWGPVNRV